MDAPIEFSASELRTRARLAAFALSDNVVQPHPQDPTDVPYHGESLTPQWLTAVLCQKSTDERALSVTVVAGDNGSSARRIIEVEWNDEGKAANLPTRLFTKSTPTLAMRLSAGMAAPSEGRFLTDLRPALPIEAPYCLYSMRDPISGRSFHLMEDLTTTQGASFCRANSTIDRGQAEQIIDSTREVFRSRSRFVWGWILNASDGNTHYEIASALATLGREGEAFDELQTAIRLGWANRQQLAHDPAFDDLKERADLRRLLIEASELVVLTPPVGSGGLP